MASIVEEGQRIDAGEAGMHSVEENADSLDDVTSEALQSRIGALADAISHFTRFHEDDGIRLKTTACMKSWYDLEGVIKMTIEYVREGVVRQQPSLKKSIKDGKSLLEEVSFRVRVYDAAMSCHEATFQLSASTSDLEKCRAHINLQEVIEMLDSILSLSPGRFKAAKRDLVQSQTVLESFDTAWKEDLLQRLSHRPVWVPNEFSRQCSRCHRPFTLIRVRHHCRSCGLIFCDRCTVVLASLPKLVYFTSQRVCLGCEEHHAPWAHRNLQQLQHLLATVFPDLMY